MYTSYIIHVYIICSVLNRCSGKCVPNFTPLRLLSHTRARGSSLTYLHNILIAATGSGERLPKRRTRINLIFKTLVVHKGKLVAYAGKLVCTRGTLISPCLCVYVIIFAVRPDRDPLAGRKLHPPTVLDGVEVRVRGACACALYAC